MIDKKIPIAIGVLIIAGFLVLALGLVGPGISFGGEKSFSQTFDAMVEKTPAEERCEGPVVVLDKSVFTAGDQIKMTDKIISIDTDSHSTTLTFIYSGTKWINESSGNSFSVQTNTGFIDVRNSVFSIQISGDLSGLFDGGDTITLRTSVFASGNDVVLGSTWVVE